MKNLQKWIKEASGSLRLISSNSDQEIIWLIEALLKKPYSFFIAHPEFTLTDAKFLSLSTALKRRLIGEPLGYIIGSVPFLDQTIEVQQPCLIPRPETEEWVSTLIDRFSKIQQNIKIADLCTGTGCIAIALGSALKNAKIIAIDIQKEAVELAQKNVLRTKLDNVQILQGDFLTPLEKKSVDLLVSNPPYLSKDEWKSLDHSIKDWEDPIALTDHQDGLFFYQELAQKGALYLKENPLDPSLPRIVCEIGHLQGISVQTIFIQNGWKKVLIKKDLSQKDRWIEVYN